MQGILWAWKEYGIFGTIGNWREFGMLWELVWIGTWEFVELKGIWDALGLDWDLGSGLCWPICIRDE